jgi:hypothetical protein
MWAFVVTLLSWTSKIELYIAKIVMDTTTKTCLCKVSLDKVLETIDIVPH